MNCGPGLSTPATQAPPRRAPPQEAHFAARAPAHTATTSLSREFAVALEEWAQQQRGQLCAHPSILAQIPLLEKYEELCKLAIDELTKEPRRRQSRADADALTAEIEMLRGERSSWQLMIELFYDWDSRQQVCCSSCSLFPCTAQHHPGCP